ncbi:MAG: S8 family serine peptidase [Xanthomonadales bacterium]|nr:S8 family serine peptidase [Xanthomonadales bacterium]
MRAPDHVVRNGITSAKVDVNSAPALAYVSYLASKQQSFIDELSGKLHRPLEVMARMQHALNAVIVRLSNDEASEVMKRADVMFIEREHDLELSTDRGPAFIGAPSIWGGMTATGVATEGEGILFGDIDSGINWESPAFAVVGPVDGYIHQNPKGNGTYLGQCAPAGVDAGKCNDKLIGIYNFAAPGTTGTDIEGHGSHTASTVAGNHWNATYANGPFTISGVAPHANVIAYLACPTTSCPSTATAQSANQAVVDGVDVINYSISGGTSPWTDATSTAFRNAVAAGAFVAASAGNTSTATPNPQGQVNHMEPWVETVAASTEDRILAVSLDLTSEASPPANTQNIPMRPGGAPLPTQNLVDVPLIKSPNFANGSTDGCAAYPAGTFTRGASPTERIFADGFDDLPPPPINQGAVAVLHLDGTASSCGSGARRTAALNAGAVGVIFVDAVYLNLGAAGTSWSMLMSDWLNLEAGSTPATATVSIDIAAQAFPGPGDQIASFSFRGPRLVSGQGMVKPDITAPGVDILAVGASSLVGPNGVILLNGTSMSSPHMAGSAVLMRALNPTWSPTQIKSALNMSSNNFGAVNQDGSPVRLWDYGSGRVNLSTASKVGLIMDETSANFVAANPAIGGDIASLNLASMAKANFVGDTVFTRTFRRARSGSQTYTLSATGFPAGAVEFSPASFTISSSGSRTITVTAHGALLASAQWTLGELTLTPSAGDEPNLHLPIALNPAGPIIQITPASISASSDTSVSTDMTIGNIGNPTLNWSVLTTGTAQVTPLNTAISGNGQQAGYYSAVSEGYYWLQNFDIGGATHVTTLLANGFVYPSGTLTTANTPSVTFSVYANNAGVPAGAPEGFGAAPVWTYTSTIGTAATTGITATSGNIQLTLSAPGVPSLDLPSGRYWMTVSPTMNTAAANPLWAWRTSADPQVGNQPVLYAPFDDPLNFQTDPGTLNMSAFVQGTVSCVLPSWVNVTPNSGSLGLSGSEIVPVVFDATGLVAGTYKATLCIGSNATNAATVAVPLAFTVPNGGPQPPTISKAFAPTSVETNVTSTLTITLNNAGPAASSLSVDLTDMFPSGLVVAATPAESTTCVLGTVTAVAGSGSVSLSSGAKIPAAGSCTVSVDVASASADVYANSIAVGALQTDTGNNAVAANASLTVTAPVYIAPTTAVAFAPTSVGAGTPSTLTITLGNTNAVTANLTAALGDSLPAGVLVAPTPNAASSCASGTVTAAAGTSLVSLASGAQIPASGSCTVTVDVRAVSPGIYTNTVPAGALQTDLGSNTAAGSDSLTVTAATFPAPYCARAFTSAVEPITLVQFRQHQQRFYDRHGWWHACVGELPGPGYPRTAWCDLQGDGQRQCRWRIPQRVPCLYRLESGRRLLKEFLRRYELGSISGSTGNSGEQTSRNHRDPDVSGRWHTRVRIVKNYNAAGLACTSSSFGQAEDYSLTLDPSAPPPPPIATLSKAFAPAIGDVSSPSTLTISLGQANGSGTATTTATLTDTFPTGLTVIAATPNASTTCPSGRDRHRGRVNGYPGQRCADSS